MATQWKKKNPKGRDLRVLDGESSSSSSHKRGGGKAKLPIRVGKPRISEVISPRKDSETKESVGRDSRPRHRSAPEPPAKAQSRPLKKDQKGKGKRDPHRNSPSKSPGPGGPPSSDPSGGNTPTGYVPKGDLWGEKKKKKKDPIVDSPEDPVAPDKVNSEHCGFEFEVEKQVPVHLHLGLSKLIGPDFELIFPRLRRRSTHPVTSVIRHCMEVSLLKPFAESKVIMPGARSSAARALLTFPLMELHVCQPSLNVKDKYYIDNVYPVLAAKYPKFSFCTNKLGECGCMPDPEVVMLTNVLYYVTGTELSGWDCPIYTIHNDYKTLTGKFPTKADTTELCLTIEAKTLRVIPAKLNQWGAEQSWSTTSGTLSVLLDDGDRYVHPPIKEWVATMGVSIQEIHVIDFDQMRTVSGLVVPSLIDPPPVVDTVHENVAMSMLLSGRRSAVDAATGTARLGATTREAVSAVASRLGWASSTRLELQVREWWAQHRLITIGCGLIGGLVLLKTRRYWWHFLSPGALLNGGDIRGNLFHMVVVAPFYEEALRTVIPGFGWFLTIVEAIASLEHRGIFGAAHKVVLHQGLNQIEGFWPRFFLHAFHNALVLEPSVTSAVNTINHTSEPKLSALDVVKIELKEFLDFQKDVFNTTFTETIEQLSKPVPSTPIRMSGDPVPWDSTRVPSADSLGGVVVFAMPRSVGSILMRAVGFVLPMFKMASHSINTVWDRFFPSRKPQLFTVEQAVEAVDSGSLRLDDRVESICVAYDARDLPTTVTAKVTRVLEPLPCESTICLQLAGPYVLGHMPFIFRQCDHNKLAALWKRNIQPYKWEFDEFGNPVSPLEAEARADGLCRLYDERLSLIVTDEMPLENLLGSNEWAIAKFTMGQAFAMLEEHRRAVSIAAFFKMFVKIEKQPLDRGISILMCGSEFTGGPGLKFDPRSIWCPEKATRYATGPAGMCYTHTLSKLIYWARDTITGLRFCYPCGYSAEQLGETFLETLIAKQDLAFVFGDDILLIMWIEQDPLFFELDASRQDHHMLQDMKLSNFEWFKKYTKHSHAQKGSFMHWFWSFMKTVHHRMTLRTKLISLRMNHGQSSGDATTSGNGTTHSCVCSAEVARLVRAGDESVNRSEFTLYGVPFKSRKTAHSYDTTFLSKVFYPALRDGYFVVLPGPKIGRIVAKTFWHVGQLKPNKSRKWLKGVCMGLLYDVNHIPILSTLVHRLLDLLNRVEAAVVMDEDWEHKIHASKPHDVHPEGWAFLACRYRCSIAELQELDIEASRVDIGSPLKLPLWETIVSTDC